MSLSTGLVHVGEQDRATLLSWTRSSSIRAGLALRAKIVLAAADGERTSSICSRLEVSRPTVSQCAPGRSRTCALSRRRRALCPLSY